MNTPTEYGRQIDRLRDNILETGRFGHAASGATLAQRRAARREARKEKAMNKCRACQAPIRWAKTVNNKSIPLDPDPVLGGNIELVGELACVLTKETVAARRIEGKPMYISHFATCPEKV
jgi:hypothetical protein